MLGFDYCVSTLPPELEKHLDDRAQRAHNLAYFFDGSWGPESTQDDLEARALSQSGDGYPYRYRICAGDLLPILRRAQARYENSWQGRLDREKGHPPPRFGLELVAALPPETVLYITSFDQS